MKWLEKVKAARAEGSFDKTMAILKEEALNNNENPVLHLQIAWTHDMLGKEQDAIPAYEKALKLGLSGQDLKDAYLGLGSTYRNVGEYSKSKELFEQAIATFPDFRPFRVFLSLTLHNLKEHSKAMEILIKELLATTSDDSIKAYNGALLFYSDKLDEKFS
ncbi:MAG: tetratricopeptide repeat protein [Bdellovibrionaceae bacterium]|nr:tetratricopeptide repeat protein [Pseudobdellovibrionaceae bacterium]